MSNVYVELLMPWAIYLHPNLSLEGASPLEFKTQDEHI
jgi:hypothetical protein